MKEIEKKIVFCVGRDTAFNDGVPLLMMGVPRGAWEYMRGGRTHHFDFTSIGLPVRMMLYGAKTHAQAMKVIEDAARQQGIPLLDERRRDFGIIPPSGEQG